uniref:GPCR4 n=1 Tax=Penaeus japonicus TaxID=27405 RepID=A0A7U3NUS1_PENJP|nr:GPCR4 [Penaeus japonicus]
MSNATLFKCHCNGNQEWDGNACNDMKTIVAVIDLHTYSRLAFNTTDFGSIVISGPPSCSLPALPLTLDSREGFEFSLMVNGSLFWNSRIYTEYCIEHTPGSSWLTRLCVSPPPVRTCCPPGHMQARNGSCIAWADGRFAPPVLVETEVMYWEAKEVGPLDIICPDKWDKLRLTLDDKNVSLLYHGGETQLKWLPPTIQQQYPDKFCVARDAESEEGTSHYVANLCFLDPLVEHTETCQNKPCVRKCCPKDQFHVETCMPVTDETQRWNPVFYNQSNGAVVEATNFTGNFTYVTGYPLCKEYFLMEPHQVETDVFHLMTDGSLYVPVFQQHFQADRYCMDNFWDPEDNVIRMLPLVCFHEEAAESKACEAMHSYLYPILLLVSCVFLGVTLLVYVSVPELHAKVHGKCLVSHVSALLIAYCSLITVQWATNKLPTVACKIMASLTHVSFLAAFFWLNVMCFDIWWTLKSMRPVAESGERSRFRFKMYSLYSWGCPLLIAVASFIVQELPEDFGVIKPDFGNTKCWFDNNKSLWAYFYGFVLTLVVANIIFFCQVAYILVMAQNDPILQRTRQQNRERMWLYVKLFLVMGITWIAEVISWQEGTCEAWVFTDVINSLQGFSIFIIFICKKNMLRKIRTKWDPYLRRMKEMVGSTRLSHSGVPNTSQVHSSFSSTSNRPNHSAASQRTVQSQISIDPTSSTRKLSASSLSPVTGVQVHSQNKLAMNTIAESSNAEAEHEQDNDNAVGSFPTPDVTSPVPQRLSSSSSGNSTADESSQMISRMPSGTVKSSVGSDEESAKLPHLKEVTEEPVPITNKDSKICIAEDEGKDLVKGVHIPSSETAYSSDESLCLEAEDGMSPDTRHTSSSRSSDDEPITINGEVPQMIDNGVSYPVSEATVVRVSSPTPVLSPSDKVITGHADSEHDAECSNSQHKNEECKEGSDNTSRPDEHQETKELSLYDYGDEEPVNV